MLNENSQDSEHIVNQHLEGYDNLPNTVEVNFPTFGKIKLFKHVEGYGSGEGIDDKDYACSEVCPLAYACCKDPEKYPLARKLLDECYTAIDSMNKSVPVFDGQMGIVYIPEYNKDVINKIAASKI